MKAYKKTLVITLIITILPCLIGMLLWNQLPEQIPTHFNLRNEADGYSSKPFAVFGLPLIMAAIQFVCACSILHDPKKKHIGEKVIHLILFIIPACSVFVAVLSFGTALGYSVNIGVISNLLIAFLFLLIGNYMPKVKQNYTMGFKLPWTLHSESNWNKTHRLAGRLWMLGGILMLLNVFLQSLAVSLAVILMSTLIPGIYSFLLYKKSIRQDSDDSFSNS